jgi:hypothetical protein
LKSLPLTIVLTVLIWLYAESQVPRPPPEATAQVGDVEVWVTGPPAIINNYDVIAEPLLVTVTVSGTRSEVEALQRDRVSAYLEIVRDDRSATQAAQEERALRVIVPAGMNVPRPPLVKFYLREKNAGGATTR